jgi:hypothetical protein
LSTTTNLIAVAEVVYSHLCNKTDCVNPSHGILEHSSVNLSRYQCFRGARNNTENFCQRHSPPCRLYLERIDRSSILGIPVRECLTLCTNSANNTQDRWEGIPCSANTGHEQPQQRLRCAHIGCEQEERDRRGLFEHYFEDHAKPVREPDTMSVIPTMPKKRRVDSDDESYVPPGYSMGSGTAATKKTSTINHGTNRSKKVKVSK